MLRKSILVTALFALAMTQALAVNCDLRCALMDNSSGIRSCDEHTIAKDSRSMEHCHGMAMQPESRTAVAVRGHRCESTICNVGLLAADEISSVNHLLVNSHPATFLPPLIRPDQALDSVRSSLLRGMERQAGDAPLEVRPGVSLRI
jgi:hypothetical protein